MRSLVSVLCVVGLASCRKESVAPPLAPRVVTLAGAYHAVSCGLVTAVFSGNPDALKDLAPGAPRSFGVESLAFRFADGSSKGFAPRGQLFFDDWTFDVFSPDCAFVVLQVDHYGPLHVVRLDDLKGYLEGKVAPRTLEAQKVTEALVHGGLTWVDARHVEFTAAAGGGAQAWRGDVQSGTVEKVFDAPSAPKGLRRTAKGYEVVP